MSVIAFIAGLFGLESKVTTYEYRDVSYSTHERHTLDLTPSVGKENDGEIGLVLFIHIGACRKAAA